MKFPRSGVAAIPTAAALTRSASMLRSCVRCKPVVRSRNHRRLPCCFVPICRQDRGDFTLADPVRARLCCCGRPARRTTPLRIKVFPARRTSPFMPPSQGVFEKHGVRSISSSRATRPRAEWTRGGCSRSPTGVDNAVAMVEVAGRTHHRHGRDSSMNEFIVHPKIKSLRISAARIARRCAEYGTRNSRRSRSTRAKSGTTR